MGAHSLETKKLREEGIPVDFYVKTLHHDKYWSAHPEVNRERIQYYRRLLSLTTTNFAIICGIYSLLIPLNL